MTFVFYSVTLSKNIFENTSKRQCATMLIDYIKILISTTSNELVEISKSKRQL